MSKEYTQCPRSIPNVQGVYAMSKDYTQSPRSIRNVQGIYVMSKEYTPLPDKSSPNILSPFILKIYPQLIVEFFILFCDDVRR